MTVVPNYTSVWYTFAAHILIIEPRQLELTEWSGLKSNSVVLAVVAELEIAVKVQEHADIRP